MNCKVLHRQARLVKYPFFIGYDDEQEKKNEMCVGLFLYTFVLVLFDLFYLFIFISPFWGACWDSYHCPLHSLLVWVVTHNCTQQQGPSVGFG